MNEGRHNANTWLLRAVFLMLVACVGAVASEPSNPAKAGPRPTREAFVGMWRLLSIDFAGVDGPMVDPFYQPGSIGLIAYDTSGHMSVQIAAPRRVSAEVSASRMRAATGADASAKAAAFDSYYAYFGTWSFDAASTVMTHHVESSLLPAEIGVDFTQDVAIEGDRLIFFNRADNQGHPTTRTKVWQRVKADN